MYTNFLDMAFSQKTLRHNYRSSTSNGCVMQFVWLSLKKVVLCEPLRSNPNTEDCAVVSLAGLWSHQINKSSLALIGLKDYVLLYICAIFFFTSKVQKRFPLTIWTEMEHFSSHVSKCLPLIAQLLAELRFKTRLVWWSRPVRVLCHKCHKPVDLRVSVYNIGHQAPNRAHGFWSEDSVLHCKSVSLGCWVSYCEQNVCDTIYPVISA